MGALTLPEMWWKYAIIIFFGLIGLIGFGSIVRDWWAGEPKPHFKLSVGGLNIEHGFAEDPMKCRYLVTGAIENSAGLSVAKNWTLEIEPPGKKKYKATRLVIRPDSFYGVSPTEKRSLSPAQSLSGQTGNQEIKGAIDGYEWFEATPLSQDDANNLQTKLTFSVQDKLGKTYSLSFSIGELKDKGRIE